MLYQDVQRSINRKQYRRVHAKFYDGFKLYHAITLMHMGDAERAAKIFEQINPPNFYFINKQFHTILYLSLGAGINKVRVYKEQLDFLISETGFKKLLHLMNDEKAGEKVKKDNDRRLHITQNPYAHSRTLTTV